MKVEQFYNKNQFIIRDGKKLVFQSYDSIIAKDDDGQSLTLGCYWDYSLTTRKHLYLFLKDYYYMSVFSKIENSGNKRKDIQKMIDGGIIKYDENLI